MSGQEQTPGAGELLKLIAAGHFYSRSDLARLTGISKNTVSSLLYGLIEQNIICEKDGEADDRGSAKGRKPVYLDIAPTAPVICGMLIKRELLCVIIADLKGKILSQLDYPFSSITAATLVDALFDMYSELKERTRQRILAIGISALGPVDDIQQKIANPAFFYGIKDLNISEIISRRSGLPAFLIHDVKAGALAEKIYGKAKRLENFLYVHIMNGIGIGCMLQNNIYYGSNGKSGEIGHTSINLNGPQCECGNRGCLDLYANIKNINKKIRHLKGTLMLPSSLPERDKTDTDYSWRQVIAACDKSDPIALAALEEFCEYLSVALTNAINLLDINDIIIGYEECQNGSSLENILSYKINERVQAPKYRSVTVSKSAFFDNAPLIGSVAVVSDRIFKSRLALT